MCDVLGACVFPIRIMLLCDHNLIYAFSSLGVYVLDMYYAVHWFDVDVLT
jgi:hypothetical protein